MKKAWHFVGATLRDGSAIPADGEWLEFKGVVKMCKSGLHASYDPFDALQYAPGATLCLVHVDDIVDSQSDKIVCRRRKIVARMDATELCRYFARQQAISCLHSWDSEPPQVMLDYLMGDDAAESAARSAAWSAAESAARSAAWSAAWSAAESAAESAARSAAESAARSAAWSAAWSAARSTAWSAAESAAWSAAWSAARNEFTQLVYECFEDFL